MALFNNIIIFILGASIGSFLNVLIDRLAKNKNINGRSQCDFCHKKIAFYDLIPLVSFFILGAKCRYCHKKLSWYYPLVETITGLSFVLIFTLGFQLFNLFIFWAVISCLIVIFFSDLKYRLISDYILLALFVFSLFFHLTNLNQFQLILTNFIPSGLIVALPIFLIYFLSKERAMGLGDVYLSAIVGFLLGWQAGFVALYIAFVTGAIFGLFLILLKRKKLKSQVPFGPFIVIGTVTMIFWGEKIVAIIRNIYKF